MINSNSSNLSSNHLISNQAVYPAITCIIDHREDIRIIRITMRITIMAIEVEEAVEEEDSTMIVIEEEAQDFNKA